MMRPILPIFDYVRCQSTGRCIGVCPTDCLDMWNDRPGVLFPQACISCGACEFVCPVGAVLVPMDGPGGEWTIQPDQAGDARVE